jgi:hypothetical protein
MLSVMNVQPVYYTQTLPRLIGVLAHRSEYATIAVQHSHLERSRDRPDETAATPACYTQDGANSGRISLKDEGRLA